MARQQFAWEYLPVRLIRALNEEAGSAFSVSITALAERYGTPPDEEFARENWEVLRDDWLTDDDAARAAVITQLWGHVGYADRHPSGRDAGVAFLRTCNNAQRLRQTVLAEFLRLGERPSGEGAVQLRQL